MGLFKDFKDDLSQAANELVSGEDFGTNETTDNLVVDTLGEEVDVKSELSKLDGLLEQVNQEPQEKVKETVKDDFFANIEEKVATPVRENNTNKEEQVKKMSDIPVINTRAVEPEKVEDETSIITESTVLTGDIQSSGSFDIRGTINGNITSNGKIVVTGVVNGNTNSAEFYADVAKVEGEVASTGTVKIGAGSVIIGNISATSAVIAGAVKGDIDVQGPVVVDTSAVIMGNIKSRSVQINNGAVIEGFCSQCYADIDVQGLFEGK